MYLIRQSIAHTLEILVPVCSDEFHVPAIQEESLFRIKTERPNAEAVYLCVNFSSLHIQEPGDDSIKLRIVGVPKKRRTHDSMRAYHKVPRRLYQLLAQLRDFFPVRSEYDLLQEQLVCRIRNTQSGLNLHCCAGRGYFRSGDIHAVAGKMLHAYMILGNKKERYAPVNTAEEGKVCSHRWNRFVMGIVHLYTECVLSNPDQAADIEDKGCIATSVIAGIDIVNPKVNLLIGPLEAYIHLLSGQSVIYPDCSLIPSHSSPVTGFVIYAVLGIPGMRNRNDTADSIAFPPERPGVVDTHFTSLSGR